MYNNPREILSLFTSEINISSVQLYTVFWIRFVLELFKVVAQVLCQCYITVRMSGRVFVV